MLNSNDKGLLEIASKLVRPKIINRGVIKEVGCALITSQGELFTGVSIHVSCGIGFCAEHSAVASMLSQSNETEIQAIVACNNKGVIPPCGRCRELLNLIDEKNLNTSVIITQNKKIKLRALLPYPTAKKSK